MAHFTDILLNCFISCVTAFRLLLH